jgi:hypothetical protein
MAAVEGRTLRHYRKHLSAIPHGFRKAIVHSVHYAKFGERLKVGRKRI